MANRIPNGSRRPRGAGFTYLGLLILLTILGLVAAAGLKTGSLMQRAAAEHELLEIGAEFSEALRSYAAATPQGQPKQPPSLQELLKDPRFPNPRRHLRKIFVDPVTGRAEWGLLYLADNKGVVGVYSLSNKRPLKVANFDARFLNMENKERIADWKFLMAGGEGVAPVPLPPPKPGGAPGSLFAQPPAAEEGKPMSPEPDREVVQVGAEEVKDEDNKPMEVKADEEKEAEEAKTDDTKTDDAKADDSKADDTRTDANNPQGRRKR